MLFRSEGPTSQQAPVYPFLVAGAYALGGVETPRSLLILELGQAALGGCLAAAVLMLAREIAPGRNGFARLAALAAALHPTLVYAATHVQVALLAATLLTATLAWAFRAGRTGSNRDSALTGLLLAMLALTDPILALAAAGVAWAIVLGRAQTEPLVPELREALPHRSDSVSRRRFFVHRPASLKGVLELALRPCFIAFLSAAIGIAPWLVRNVRVHGELVLIKSTFGYAFWQGNCALSEGTDKVVRRSVETALEARGEGLQGLNESLWKARHEAGYLDDIALKPADYRQLGQLSEPARSRWLFARAVADLRTDPGRYPRLCLRRLRYFLLFDETNPKTRTLVYRASQLGLTLWAVLGLTLAKPTLLKRLAPTFLTAALVTLFHALTITSVRFHIPLEPLMGLWGAAGISRWWPGTTGGQRDDEPSSHAHSVQRGVPAKS